MDLAKGGPHYRVIEAHRQAPIRVHHLVSQDHASDNRRPNQVSGLIYSGPCIITGYAQTGYVSL